MTMPLLCLIAAVCGALGIWMRSGGRRHRELERFRAAVNLCDDAIYTVDRQTMSFVDLTAAATVQTGHSREQLLALGPAELWGTSNEELAAVYDAVIRAAPAGVRSEHRGRSRGGRATYVEVDRHAFRRDGRWYIVARSRDVTERKRAERAAQRIARMYDALSDTNEAIMRVATADELYRAVCDAAVGGGKLLAACVCIPDAGSGTAVVTTVSGAGAASLRDMRICIDADLAEGRGLVGTAFRSQQPCISNDYLRDARTESWHAAAREAGIAAGAAFPLVQHGRTAGILLLHAAHRNVFDEEIVKLLAHIARNVVFALDNLERERERGAAEEELRGTQARLDRVTRGANDGLWELDVASGAVWVSPRFAEMLGFDYDEFSGNPQKFFEVIYADDAAVLRGALAVTTSSGVIVDMELRALVPRARGARARCCRHADDGFRVAARHHRTSPISDGVDRGHRIGRPGQQGEE
jgi:PAS domain S-box-containing protein